MPRPTALLRSRFLRFRREALVLAYAAVDRDTPFRLRVAGFGVLLYLISPFDLLPEMLPLVGILDDIAIVPWGVSLIVARLPEAAREKAEAGADRWLERYLARPLGCFVLVVGVLLVVWSLTIWLIAISLT